MLAPRSHPRPCRYLVGSIHEDVRSRAKARSVYRRRRKQWLRTWLAAIHSCAPGAIRETAPCDKKAGWNAQESDVTAPDLLRVTDPRPGSRAAGALVRANREGYRSKTIPDSAWVRQPKFLAFVDPWTFNFRRKPMLRGTRSPAQEECFQVLPHFLGQSRTDCAIAKMVFQAPNRRVPLQRTRRRCSRGTFQ